MKRKILKFCTLLTAILLMAVTLAACGSGGDNPFLGDWDDDDGEQSMIFREDGTGAQTSYYGEIDFTYTWEGDTATIANEEMGVSAEVTLEDGALYTGYSSFVKVDEAEYVPENQETGMITITFDGEGTFGYSNNIIGEAGSGTYTYDGETLIVTIFQDGEEVSHAGLVGEDDYAVHIAIWDDADVYYAD